MTTPELARIRAALTAYQAATTLAETLDAVGEMEDACSADVMPAVLAHIDEQQAEIERLNADRHVLQATGDHPAPCARHCEAQAFKIEIRRLQAEIDRLKRGEYICLKCGLRKTSEHPATHDF